MCTYLTMTCMYLYLFILSVKGQVKQAVCIHVHVHINGQFKSNRRNIQILLFSTVDTKLFLLDFETSFYTFIYHNRICTNRTSYTFTYFLNETTKWVW